MKPASERIVAVPIVELPPNATAGSIADLLLGASWSGGDNTSSLLTWADQSYLAFSTVTIPLSQLECMSQGMFTVEDLLEKHTLCALASLGLPPDRRENLITRAVAGQEVAVSRFSLPLWVCESKHPALTCTPCEWKRWELFGVRVLVCQDQIPFMTACFDCGNVLTRRVPGGAPPPPRERLASESARAFAQVGARMATEARDPDAIRIRLQRALRAADYVDTELQFNVGRLELDYRNFCRGSLPTPALRELSLSSYRMNHIVAWIKSSYKKTINPIFLILFDYFLERIGAQGSDEQKLSGEEVVNVTRQMDIICGAVERSNKPAIFEMDHRYVLSDVRILIDEGYSKVKIAEIGGWELRDVCRYIKYQHGLEATYCRRQFECRRDKHRALVMALVNAGASSITEISRNGGSSARSWLWKNDKNWMFELKRSMDSRKERKRISMLSKEREILAERINKVVFEIKSRLPPVRCSRALILREIGVTNNAMSKAEKDSKRIAAIARNMVETDVEFFARRVSFQGLENFKIFGVAE